MTQPRNTAEDGQHRHGTQSFIEVDNLAMVLLAKHLRESDCIVKPIHKNARIPIEFYTCGDANPGKAKVICGICKKELGLCTLREANRRLGDSNE